jgi:hypothetical protein
MLQTNPDNQEFINAIKNLQEGETIEVADGTLLVEAVFSVPTHFRWHQNIFKPGMILKKQDSNARVYVSATQLGWTLESYPEDYFEDRQIVDGEVLSAQGHPTE